MKYNVAEQFTKISQLLSKSTPSGNFNAYYIKAVRSLLNVLTNSIYFVLKIGELQKTSLTTITDQLGKTVDPQIQHNEYLINLYTDADKTFYSIKNDPLKKKALSSLTKHLTNIRYLYDGSGETYTELCPGLNTSDTDFLRMKALISTATKKHVESVIAELKKDMPITHDHTFFKKPQKRHKNETKGIETPTSRSDL